MDNLGSLCARPIFDVDDQPARPLLGRWLTGEKGYMEKPGALGAWQDVPMVRPGVDQQRPGIREHQDLLALIDGQRSLAQLCAQSGLTEEDLVRRLTSLLKVGAIQVHSQANGQGPSPTPKSDALILEQAGWVGRIPPRPALSAGVDLRAHWRPPSGALDPQCDLPEAFQHEVLFLLSTLATVDHFELFGIEPTADRREIKRGFFSFSKRFHPDCYFGKALGRFGDLLQQLFEYGNAVHDALLKHDALREAYARAVEARNTRHLELTGAARPKAEPTQVETPARRRTPTGPITHPIEGLRRPSPDEPPTGPITDRKARLREIAAKRRRVEAPTTGPKAPIDKSDLEARLQARKQARRDRQAGLPAELKARLAQAEGYYQEAMKHIAAERPVQGASLLRMALSLDPRNTAYQEALDTVDERARALASRRFWTDGQRLEKDSRYDDAMVAYREAVRLKADPGRLAHLTQFALDHMADSREAVGLAEQWAKLCPEQPTALMALAQAYESAGLNRRAVGALEQLLSVDPGHKEARKYLRGIKRKS